MRGTFEEPPTGLIPWFSKTEGNTYATIAASPFPLQGKPTQAQDVAAPPTLVDRVWASWSRFFFHYFLLIPKRDSVKFQVIPRTFIYAQR